LEQEDFIKRQIDQLGRALEKILSGLMRLKVRGQTSQGIESVSQDLKTELGLNLEDLTLIPTESFLTTLLDTRKFSDNNFEQLAEIMFLIAEELNTRNIDVSKMKQLYERALVIFEILDQTSTTYSYDRHSKIEKIKEVL
jgi:hypothetical protein